MTNVYTDKTYARESNHLLFAVVQDSNWHSKRSHIMYVPPDVMNREELVPARTRGVGERPK